MPSPCDYDSEDDFHSACVAARQDENPDEDIAQSNAVCFAMWRDRDCGRGKVFKTGHQSKSDAFEFVMSTADVDRVGDRVEQDWDLTEFRANPIALYSHNAELPIGTWTNVRVEGGRLLGRLKLAKAGTSRLIDTVRSLVEQRILKAVSVGFVPGKSEPLKGAKRGYRLAENKLLECSLVAIPANAAALAVTRSLPADVRGLLFAETGDTRHTKRDGSRAAQSRDSDPTPKRNPKQGTARMNVSERIEARQTEIGRLQEQLDELQLKMDGDGLTDEEHDEVKTISDEIDRAQKDLDTLTRMEKAAQVRAERQTTGPALSSGQKDRDPKHLVGATLASMVRAYHEHRDPGSVVRDYYKDEPEIGILVKAAQDPAMTSVPAWAGNLVRETWDGFMAALYDVAVYPRVPGRRLTFDGYGSINIPVQNGGGLAGDFIEEGDPIPVKATTFGKVSLAPKALKVITHATNEMLRRSMPALEGLLRDQLIEDTAKALDTYFLDDTAASSSRPAGLRDTTGTGAANIVATNGPTIANIIADFKALAGRLNAVNIGSSGAWIMNRITAMSLSLKQDAASGDFPFRSEIASGTFFGYPIIYSNNVAADYVYYVDSQAMAFASGLAPVIDVSREATLHEENTVAGVKPIVDGTGNAAQPVRSLFQTDTVALRLRMETSWGILRQGGVQVLTGTSAW